MTNEDKRLHYMVPLTNERKFYRRPNSNVIIAVKCVGKIDIDKLSTSIPRLFPKYPRFFACITEKDNRLYFSAEQSNKIPIDVKSSNSDLLDTKDLEKYIQIEHKHLFNFTHGPLSRITVITYNEGFIIIFNSHHVTCDGMSLLFLIKDLFLLLDDPRLELEKDPFHLLELITPRNRVKFSFKSRIKLQMMKKFDRKYHFKHSEDEFRELHKKFWEKNVSYISFALDESTSLKLIECAQDHKISINSVVYTALFKAQQNELQSNDRYRKLVINPVNIRDMFDPSAKEFMGIYASGVSFPFKWADRLEFWQNAQEFNKQINSLIQNKQMLVENYYFMVEMNKNIIDTMFFSAYEDIGNSTMKKISKSVKSIQASMSLDNLGRYSYPTKFRNYEITEIYGPIVYSEMVEAVFGLITVNNRMCFGITFSQDVISSEKMNKIIIEFQTILRSLSHQN